MITIQRIGYSPFPGALSKPPAVTSQKKFIILFSVCKIILEGAI